MIETPEMAYLPDEGPGRCGGGRVAGGKAVGSGGDLLGAGQVGQMPHSSAPAPGPLPLPL